MPQLHQSIIQQLFGGGEEIKVQQTWVVDNDNKTTCTYHEHFSSFTKMGCHQGHLVYCDYLMLYDSEHNLTTIKTI